MIPPNSVSVRAHLRLASRAKVSTQRERRVAALARIPILFVVSAARRTAPDII